MRSASHSPVSYARRVDVMLAVATVGARAELVTTGGTTRTGCLAASGELG